ncbi:MAG: COP23 domain-containing protein [Stigonema ocellatum SAG 48.90 = DSM 106950]|nr:COP23 domain-containing protein [Stigonema ocellatum SAG 48.90 = DSM 106950]
MRQPKLGQVLIEVTRVFAIASLTATTTATINQPSYAVSATFDCGQNQDGVPVTFAHTQDGKNVPMIRWVSNNYFSEKLNPKQRCQQVSQRFQRNFENGNLRYIKAGVLNGQPVICAAAQKNAPCTDSTLLFTLKRGSDASATARKLFYSSDLANGNGIDEVGGDKSHDPLNIDVESYLYFRK